MAAQLLAEYLRTLAWDGELAFDCRVAEHAQVPDWGTARLALELAQGGEERGEMPDGDAGGVALQRVQTRLDLILRLLVQVLHQGVALPAPRPVRLNEYGMAWAATAPCAEGPALLTLALDGGGLPLRLPVRLLASAAGATRCIALFERMPDDLREALRKHVFRAHRRQRAQAQRQSGYGTS